MKHVHEMTDEELDQYLDGCMWESDPSYRDFSYAVASLHNELRDELGPTLYKWIFWFARVAS